jgi:H-NS histone family
MGMLASINLFEPAAWNTVVSPRSRGDRWLLQDKKIIAPSPSPFAHAHPQVVPSDEIDAFEAIRNTLVVCLAQTERVDPTHQIAARCREPRALSTAAVNIVIGHRGQRSKFWARGYFVSTVGRDEKTSSNLSCPSSPGTAAAVGVDRDRVGTVAPKYRNPDNPAETWAGRGLRPRWLTAALKGDKKLEDFAIGGAAKASATRQPKKTRKVRKARK